MEIDICIIGAGPAGLMAAVCSAKAGAKTLVVETNTAAARKLILTGGGRCNLTHNCNVADFLKAFGEKSKFVKHCLYNFTPQDLRQFFEERGLPTKVLEDNCVFPASERSSDVRDLLVKESVKAGVQFLYNRRIEKIEKNDYFFAISNENEKIISKKTIIATGGLSYPQTGSNGDGFKLAQKLFHTIITPKPALVPLITSESWPGRLAGVSMENVKLTANLNAKKILSIGDMLFTQDGIGGPAVMDLSRLIVDYLFVNKIAIPVSIDTINNLSSTYLERKFLQLVEENPKKTLKGILSFLYPQRFAVCFCDVFSFDEEKIARQTAKVERKRLVNLLKAIPLNVTGTRPIEEATITRGGVFTNEIESKTMESKICRGLYFAGEVIDVDGPCGGFNLQFAFSSGALAGKSAAKSLLKKFES